MWLDADDISSVSSKGGSEFQGHDIIVDRFVIYGVSSETCW
jgi:hypothetical protein